MFDGLVYEYSWIKRGLILLSLSYVGNLIQSPRLFASDALDRKEDQRDSDPGFFDQWSRMKASDSGRLARGAYLRWYRRDLEMKASEFSKQVTRPVVDLSFLGPQLVGGRTRALLIDSRNNDRIFAGAISGGLWRSSDRGRSWDPVDDSAFSLAVSGISQDPFQPLNIYYCTGEARANTAGVMGAGLFVSRDGGENFRQLVATSSDPRFDRCWCIANSPCIRNTIFVGTESGGLMRSRDSGTTWMPVLQEGPVTDIVCLPGGVVLAGVSGKGLFRSASGNPGTFIRVCNWSFPRSFRRIEIANCACRPHVIYAAFESDTGKGGTRRLCASLDGGCTWSVRRVPETGATYNRYCFTLAVHPVNPFKLICGGRFALESRDGGCTWARIYNSHSDYHAVVTFPGDTNRFLVGNDGGVYEYSWSSPDNVAKDLNQGYHVTQFYAGDFNPIDDAVLGGTQDNGTLKITGDSHRIVGRGDGTYCHVSLQDPNRAYLSAQRAVMMRSDDYQSDEPNWVRIDGNELMNSEGYVFVNPYVINRADGNQLYCRTNESLWRSLDGGENWTRLTKGTTPGLFAIACASSSDPVVYAGGEDCLLIRVDDAATDVGHHRFLSMNCPAALRTDFLGAIAIHPGNTDTVLVGFTDLELRPRIWKVTNCNTDHPSWTEVSGDMPPMLPVNSIAIDPASPDSSYFIATDFGLYFTVDGGTHWFKEEGIPNVSIHQMRFRPSDRSLFLFTHGRGAWKVELHP